MIYCIWGPLIIPISEISPHTTLCSRSALYTNYFRGVFPLLLEELKYQPQHEMTVCFLQGMRYFWSQESLPALQSLLVNSVLLVSLSAIL